MADDAARSLLCTHPKAPNRACIGLHIYNLSHFPSCARCVGLIMTLYRHISAAAKGLAQWRNGALEWFRPLFLSPRASPNRESILAAPPHFPMRAYQVPFAPEIWYNLIHSTNSSLCVNYLSRFALNRKHFSYGVREYSCSYGVQILPPFISARTQSHHQNSASRRSICAYTNRHVHGFQHRAAEASCFLRVDVCWRR